MDIRETLLIEHSAEIRNRVIKYVGEDPIRMKELMNCFFDQEKRVCQRASWPLNIVARRHPNLMKPFHKKMMTNLNKPLHDAAIRNTIRIYEDIDIPKSIEGLLFEKCFNYLCDPKMAIAIRAFSITVLEKLVDRYPDLKNELIAVLEEHILHGSAGFNNRAKKCLRRLKVSNKSQS